MTARQRRRIGLLLIILCGSALAAGSRKLQALLAEQVRGHHLAGMAAIVVRSDGVVAFAAAGVRKQGERAPLEPGDLFHLGSNTKAITATMIARLIEAGKLSFGTTPVQVFPELRETIYPAFRGITMEQLLSHHAGIPAYTDIHGRDFQALPKIGGSASEQRAKFAAWVLQHPPAVAPGTAGLYSNAGFAIAAAMAERIAGASWETLVRSEVLEPLGMRAIYGWPLAAGANQPWGHVETKRGLKAVNQDEAWQIPAYLLPAGGIAMSLEDYGRFLQMNLKALRGEESKFLTVAAVKRIHSSPVGDKYALGWGLGELDGVASSTHAGSAGSFYAIVALQPGRDEGIAVFANSGLERTGKACATVLDALLLKYSSFP